MAHTVKNLPAMGETQVPSLGWEDLLEKEMATHSSILAGRIPQTVDHGRLQSMEHKESDMTERLHFTSLPHPETGGKREGTDFKRMTIVQGHDVN